MERQQLEIALREGKGKSVTRKLRVLGKIPGVAYGSGIEPTMIVVDDLALAKVLRSGANALVDLSGVKALAGKPMLVKDVQRDPLSRRVVHYDLYAVNLAARLDVEVPLHFVGIPKGSTLDQGVLDTVMREIEVSCMPLAIPEHIEVDVSNLMIGDSIHVRDLVLPADVVVKADPEATVVHLVAPRAEEEPVVAAAAEGAEGAAAAPAEGAAAAPAAGDKEKKD